MISPVSVVVGVIGGYFAFGALVCLWIYWDMGRLAAADPVELCPPCREMRRVYASLYTDFGSSFQGIVTLAVSVVVVFLWPLALLYLTVSCRSRSCGVDHHPRDV